MGAFVTGSEFNRFVNLDNIEWNIINALINSNTKYAENLWKILYYNTEDCLLKPNLTRKQKLNLIYTNNGDSTTKRVFMSPFTDDAWTEQSSHLHIYVSNIIPANHLTSKVHISIETIVHNKIANISGDVLSESGDSINPVEMTEDGQPIVLFKNRETVLLKSLLAELNGQMVNGVGVLQFNTTISPFSTSKQCLWNGHTFYGHLTNLVTFLSGTSADSNVGY